MNEQHPSSQRIVPYLLYRDAPAAIDFLTRAFGFEERFRYPMDDGRIGHAEMTYQGSVVMLASAFDGFGASPLDLPNVHGLTVCVVDHVDRHFERARSEGATLVSEPGEQHGSRTYRAMDPEGHRWMFMQPLGDD
jgi:uncharacterized glyoxalase superfamily protein PhnB